MSQSLTKGETITRQEVEELLAEQRKQFGEQIEALEQHVEERIEEEREAFEERLAEKDERIEALEQQVEEQATVEWRGQNDQAQNLWVGNYPLGKAIKRHGQRLNEQEWRIEDLERGEIDVDDVLDHEETENQLPIQRDNAARKADAPADLSENKERATHVWAAFHERSQSGHGKLRMPSWVVKQILEQNGCPTNPTTVRRVMEFVAKGTSQVEDAGPEDDKNLITLKRATEKNTLVAEQDEWESFFAEQMKAVGASDENAQEGVTDDEDGGGTADGDAVAGNIDGELDALSSASAVTSDETDSVAGDITVS